MNVRNSLVATILAAGCLLGVSGTANALPTEPSTMVSFLEIPTAVKPVCQWPHYKLTQDLNGRWYCKWAPVNRNDRPRH